VSELDAHVPAICAGDPEAFARWLAGAEPRIRASLSRFATAVDTEAVLQEALLRLWQVAPRLVDDGRPDGLLRLGVRIARNAAISEIRRHAGRRPAAADLADADEPGSPSPPDPFLRTAILECHDRLPARPRAALDARLGSDGARADADLAARLSMTKNTFLQNITRARKLLAECLERKGIAL
jgi:RNA polymerase sigma-70 factor (ECF subfamily)